MQKGKYLCSIKPYPGTRISRHSTRPWHPFRLTDLRVIFFGKHHCHRRCLCTIWNSEINVTGQQISLARLISQQPEYPSCNHTIYNITDISFKVTFMQRISWTDSLLTHCGRVTHIWISKSTIINSDNGLSPSRCQANIYTSAGILLIGP